MRTNLLTLFTLSAAGAAFLLSSCETVDQNYVGRGAFDDDSYISSRLDSNNPNLDGNIDPRNGIRNAPKSFQQWREEQDQEDF